MKINLNKQSLWTAGFFIFAIVYSVACIQDANLHNKRTVDHLKNVIYHSSNILNAQAVILNPSIIPFSSANYDQPVFVNFTF